MRSPVDFVYVASVFISFAGFTGVVWTERAVQQPLTFLPFVGLAILALATKPKGS